MTIVDPHLDVDQLSAAVDGERNPAVAAHLLTCLSCREQVDAWRRALAPLRDLPAPLTGLDAMIDTALSAWAPTPDDPSITGIPAPTDLAAEDEAAKNGATENGAVAGPGAGGRTVPAAPTPAKAAAGGSRAGGRTVPATPTAVAPADAAAGGSSAGRRSGPGSGAGTGPRGATAGTRPQAGRRRWSWRPPSGLVVTLVAVVLVAAAVVGIRAAGGGSSTSSASKSSTAGGVSSSGASPAEPAATPAAGGGGASSSAPTSARGATSAQATPVVEAGTAQLAAQLRRVVPAAPVVIAAGTPCLAQARRLAARSAAVATDAPDFTEAVRLAGVGGQVFVFAAPAHRLAVVVRSSTCALLATIRF